MTCRVGSFGILSEKAIGERNLSSTNNKRDPEFVFKANIVFGLNDGLSSPSLLA